jgi:ribosomal protein S18 acetylase RimI-like enzyme
MHPGLKTIALRPATVADDAFLFQVYASTRNAELEGIGWDYKQKNAFLSMQFEAQRLSYGEGDNKIILLDGRAVGRILVRRTDAEISLVDIALLAEIRNGGIGTNLIQGLLEEAAVAGKPVRLHVLSASPAIRLYERLGFSRIVDDGMYTEMTWLPTSSLSSKIV